MKTIILHKDGSVSYRSPISDRWIRHTDLPCAGDLGGLTVAEQVRVIDHLWSWAFRHADTGQYWRDRFEALRNLGDAVRRQREHKGE